MITQSEFLHAGINFFSVQRTAGLIPGLFIGIVVCFTCVCTVLKRKAVGPKLKFRMFCSVAVKSHF